MIFVKNNDLEKKNILFLQILIKYEYTGMYLSF